MWHWQEVDFNWGWSEDEKSLKIFLSVDDSEWDALIKCRPTTDLKKMKKQFNRQLKAVIKSRKEDYWEEPCQ